MSVADTRAYWESHHRKMVDPTYAEAWKAAQSERRARAIETRQAPDYRREQFSRAFIPEPNSGCFLWCRAIDRDGYGMTRHKGKLLSAHRFSWILHRGAIPDGLHVLHRCDVRCCVNPAHLWLGTHLENVADMIAKGRHGNGATVLKRGFSYGRMAA